MYRSGYTTGVEAYPYLALDSIPSLNMEWACKINSCESKGGLRVHTEVRQWRWRWAYERFPFKSFANDTPVYAPYGIDALDRRPPHLQTPFSSKKRPNCPFNFSNWESCVSCNWAHRIHNISRSVGCGLLQYSASDIQKPFLTVNQLSNVRVFLGSRHSLNTVGMPFSLSSAEHSAGSSTSVIRQLWFLSTGGHVATVHSWQGQLVWHP